MKYYILGLCIGYFLGIITGFFIGYHYGLRKYLKRLKELIQ